MPGETGMHVRNWRELNQAFARTDKNVKKQWRATERRIAEPVRRDAETLTLNRISGMARSPAWARMRTGITQKLVYVAPRRRGLKQGRGKRPNLAPLMMGRAMEPALEKNRPEVEREIERLLDTVADDFNRGGP